MAQVADHDDPVKPKRIINPYFKYIGVFVTVILVWLLGAYGVDLVVGSGAGSPQVLAERGQFGDKFGAVNALFSGLAFAGIIITLLLQRGELAETRRSMAHERFDNTFFKLLDLHIDITEKISMRGNAGQYAFHGFMEYLIKNDSNFAAFSALQKINSDRRATMMAAVAGQSGIRAINTDDYPELTTSDVSNLQEAVDKDRGVLNRFDILTPEEHKEKIIQAYKKTATEYIDNFSHYYRNLYHILKFVKDSCSIDEATKKQYVSFVRSQLSDIELVNIFYNSIAEIKLPGRDKFEMGYPKMRTLLIEYDVLQNMNPKSLIHPAHLEIFYTGQ